MDGKANPSGISQIHPLAIESDGFAKGSERALQLKANLAIAARKQETFWFHRFDTKLDCTAKGAKIIKAAKVAKAAKGVAGCERETREKF